MNTFNKNLLALSKGLLIGMLGVSPVLADDTEIYLGSPSGLAAVNPNILFVVDTSGSMEALTTDEGAAYDPLQTYPGSYVATRTYYSTTNVFTNTTPYFDTSNLKCSAALTAIAATGMYTGPGRLAQWRVNSGSTYRWLTINATNRKVECQADSGTHGQAASDGLPYASNNSGSSTAGWSSIAGQSVTWGSTGDTYTLKSGNYRNWETGPAGATISKSRINAVKDGLTALINSMSNANIGLMRFDSSANGGMVIQAMGDIETNRASFLTQVQAMVAAGSTPLSETMYEAAKYYRGGGVDYGNGSRQCLTSHINNGNLLAPDYGVCDTDAALRSVPASRTGATSNTYQSPISNQCQKNYLVFLTDGDPTSDAGVDAARKTSIGMTAAPACGTGTTGTNYSANCLDDIAGHLAGQDQSIAYQGEQFVSTFTIGFGTGISAAGEALLQNAANASKNAKPNGVGAYKVATNTATLVTEFVNIISDISGANNTFSSPAVSVNAFNRTTHRDELYFSLFTPSYGTHWDGNFKRYRLDIDSNGNPVIVDKGNIPAIDPDTGYFLDGATSIWSDAVDGGDVQKGGAASNLSNTRKVYTYTGSTNTLSNPTNLLHESNPQVTAAMLGVAASDRDKLLQWARGLDVDDLNANGSVIDERKVMGDPLHGEPVLIQYGGTVAAPDITAYVPTNDGYLHAFDVSSSTTVSELFSFVPAELLGNLSPLYQDSAATTKLYGLDGSITPWVKDNDKDGDLSDSGDHAYIYFGMRRGGNNYYAMDVTNRANPKLKWTILGGSGDFAELSQSWSQPQLRKLRFNGADKMVVIFAGGYDTNQDAVSLRTADSKGRAIYIVDAETGDRLWWAGPAGSDLNLSDMDYSIPSTVAISDADGDGYADLMHVGDMGGQLWRFDIAMGNAAGDDLDTLVTGGRIADFAANSSADNTRRFYYPPSVAIAKSDSGERHLALALASGYREHPLNTVIDDRIYMVKDSPVKGKPASYVTLDEGDLFDTTDNLVRTGDAAQKAAAAAAMESASGWYIRLEIAGEKGLAKGLIFGDAILITTYIPTDPSAATDACKPLEGTGRLYVLDLGDGGAYKSDLTIDRNQFNLLKPGIPADPKMILTEDPDQKDYAVCIGTECMTAPVLTQHQKLYWLGR
jgi:type IV pilus assembly protein PilY1